MGKKSKIILFSLLLVLLNACQFMPIKTLSSKEVPLNTKYKMANSNNQFDYSQTKVFGLALNPEKDWGVLVSEMQGKDNCAFLKNVEFRVQAQSFLFVDIKTTVIKAQCWVKE